MTMRVIITACLIALMAAPVAAQTGSLEEALARAKIAAEKAVTARERATVAREKAALVLRVTDPYQAFLATQATEDSAKAAEAETAAVVKAIDTAVAALKLAAATPKK